MSLDQNLFTLFFTPNPAYPAGTVVDLTDGQGTIHYRKRRIIPSSQHQVYCIQVSDPLSEAVLASVTAPSATSKHKTLELYNPSHVVELKYTGTLTFRWSFQWETHEFEWKREECFIVRKPDPPVLVAVTKEPPGRMRTASVQILDYNLHRFDIEDRKGLEIVILTALLTFSDASDVYHEPTPSPSSTTPVSGMLPSSVTAPTLPPKPAPKKGVERIAELQLGRGQVNEVTVFEDGAVREYAKHCVRLLQDDAMLFISVCPSDSSQVSKVLQVVEETKRLRHKAGDPDVHQYVLYDAKKEVTLQKGPRIIHLDDDEGKGKKKAYTPPERVTVHLSKIDMPELQPRGTTGDDRGKKDASEWVGGRARGSRWDRDGDGNGHATVLHKQRSQYVDGTSYRAPPLPPRSQHPSGMPRRPSMYGSLNKVSREETSTTGLFGRFLAR